MEKPCTINKIKGPNNVFCLFSMFAYLQLTITKNNLNITLLYTLE